MRIAGAACESARAALHTTHDHDEKRRWRGGYVVEQRRARGAEAEAEREEEEDVDDDDDDDDEKQRRSSNSSSSSSSKCFSPVMGSQWVGGQYWVVGGGWWCACNNGRTDEQHSTSRHDRRQCGKNYLPSPTLCDRHESYLLLLLPPYISVHCLPIPKHALGFYIVGVVDSARLPTLPTTHFLLCVPASGLSVESNSPAAARGDRVTDITVIQYRMHPKSHLHDTAPWTWIVAGCIFRSTTCSHIECTIYTYVPISR